MKVIKPYGRSHVEPGDTGANKRILRLRVGPETATDIEKFAHSNDRLVITQWVSVIDKIAAKPQGTNGPTLEQREFRERLGNAAWAFLEANRLLPGLNDPALRDHLTKFWRVKIAPYGATPYRPPRTPGRPAPSAKGRWYQRFVGDVAVADVDASAVAERIGEHLYRAEYRLSAAVSKRAQGHISGRAKSIAINVPRPLPAEGGVEWSSAELETYARAGNIAQQIRSAAQRREKGEDKAGTRRVTVGLAAAELFQHYAKVFRHADGQVLSIREARERAPGLFALHTAVKDCYSRLLKNHRKDAKGRSAAPRHQKSQDAEQGGPKVSDLLPATMTELAALVAGKTANRDLNALVRLGKVIHYEASGDAQDRTIGPLRNWPGDLSGSFYWTSDGQAIIKRNEAFVRVWRHVLALASRTLMDWADPAGQIRGDILLRKPIELATGEAFDHTSYLRKIGLLLGNRAAIFEGADQAFNKNALRLALEGTAELRHSAFHFKGLGDFADALTASRIAVDEPVRKAVRRLWDEDVRVHQGQLLKTMRVALFDYFFDEEQNRRFADACGNAEPVPVPLPRFAKMLRRAENAWSEAKDDLRLPKPANRIELEKPGRFAQYTALKLIYETAFRSWLHQCKAPALNGFIDRAVARGTGAARDLNAGDDPDRQEIIVARAAILSRLDEDDDVEAFFSDLSAETATEMRVQRGYASDPDKAREQAAYIENLKCDVVALAFRAFLTEAEFEFLLALSPEMEKPSARQCDLGVIPPRQVTRQPKDWQAILYFLMHLVPVEEIGQLLHQIRKWNTLAAKQSLAKPGRAQSETMGDTVQRLQEVLQLYLDMHDTKFEGGASLTGTQAFKELYESEGLFNQIFPKDSQSDGDRRIPRRGLREIMRFGHLPVLRPVFHAHQVKATEVSRYLQAEAVENGHPRIERWQAVREELHEKWIKAKGGFSLQEIRNYVDALTHVVQHRHLAAHVTLTNHVRLHRLLMTILGRLVDYAGLWERDLYFVTLALMHRAGARPEQVLAEEGLRHLGQGRITAALRRRKPTPEGQALAAGLERHFGNVHEPGCIAVRVRNDFAHFNMLKPGSPPVDLTDCVNAGRYLMSYDRKLKNAVSQSIKERLHREGLTLGWTMETSAADHYLGPATLQTRQARHLGKITLRESGRSGRDARPPRRFPIVENLHGDHFVRMAAALFARCAARDQRSVVELPLDRIDWQPFGGDQRSRIERTPERRGRDERTRPGQEPR